MASTAHVVRVYLLVAIVVCGFFTLMIMWSCNCDSQPQVVAPYAPMSMMPPSPSKLETYLLVTVLSSPGDATTRAVIRDTWKKLSAKGPEVVRIIFPVGTEGLSDSDTSRLRDESEVHGDLAMLDGLKEDYSNLTRKTLHTMQYAHQHYKFQFLLKVDSDSFVRLGALLKALRDIAHPRLYWGFLDGRAKPIRKGKWKESDWILCDRYLPYQLGGGYVLAAELVGFIATNAHLLKLYKNEDVAVGTWLAGVDVKYVHDPRFDTEFKSRGCSNQYLITHKKGNNEMISLYSSLLSKQVLCEKEFQVRPSYVYDWSAPPSQCCVRHNGSNIP